MREVLRVLNEVALLLSLSKKGYRPATQRKQ
jgi:hypothetical protein